MSTMSRLAWLVFILTFAYASWIFPQLPDRIPMHFGPDGTPDAWGPRGSIFFAVGFSLFLQLFLTFVPKLGASVSPQIQKSKDPAAELAWALDFIAKVRVWVAGLFLLIVWNTTSVALGHATGLGWTFFIYTFGGVIVVLFVAIRRSRRSIGRT
jgi:uncharacterized membrane protein